MCGFTGWFDVHPQGKDVLEHMTKALVHRGPDGEGYYYGKGPVALGHRRLAVIDLTASMQPMLSPNGNFALAYNGELYNYRQLRTELELLGHLFCTAGDTEVLLHALMEWGEAALPKLEGMFAFAFWDAKRESLLLARDPLGIKPLFFCWDGRRLLFASEIKALLKHPDVSREIDPQAISLYLECQYIPAPVSIYRQIRKLPAAHILRLEKGKLEEKRYWTPSYEPKFLFDEETALEHLEKELRHSVSSMLVADVPIGAFLSGGIDSSVIAALMQAESNIKPKLFHLGFHHQEHSEHEHAAKVASFLNAEYYPLIAQAEDVLGVLDTWVEAFDEPFGDQAALPTLLLSKFAREQVTVVLTGEGADEIFAGYSNYAKRLKEAPLCSRLGHRYSPLRAIYPYLPVKLRKNRVLKAAAQPLSRRYTTIPNLFDRETHTSLLSPEFCSTEQTNLTNWAEKYYLGCNGENYLDKMLHIDTSLWLPDDLLTKMDRASMIYSLEARVPYLNHRLVDFAARLPVHWKLNSGTSKYLLKKLAETRGLLPKEIIHRSKQGFVMPLRSWLAGALRPTLNDALSPQGLAGRNLFRPGAIERLRKEEDSTKRFHATRLWSLLTLELWLRRYAPDFRF
jgi:asparagine synthase (glutamine-hydrolysing)